MDSTKQPRVPTILGGISPEQFLDQYWQKQPLLIRQAFPNFESPIDGNELAGLALEEDVESRLIIEHPKENRWELKSGPFTDSDFGRLPSSHWTLLIQQLDAWSSEINAIKRAFNFIPNWRIDDVMASYAPIGGSVGPHFDNYDVFLVQANGTREWKTGQNCGPESPTLLNTPLCILEHFDERNKWTLAPGDMLYLPPKLAHYGIASSDACITLSIGFRAPTASQLLGSFTDFILERSNHPAFYEDPTFNLQDNPGEIVPAAQHAIKALLNEQLNNNIYFTEWLGEFLTEAKNPATLVSDDSKFDIDRLIGALNDSQTFYRNEGSRFAYIHQQDNVQLFVDGKSFTLSEQCLAFVKLLCLEDEISAEQLQKSSATLRSDEQIRPVHQVLCELINLGSLLLED